MCRLTCKNLYDRSMSIWRKEIIVVLMCRSGYVQLRSIGHFRCYLSNDATKSSVHGLVMSRLDYCNAPPPSHGLPYTMMNKIQRVENMAAPIVTRTSRHNRHYARVKETPLTASKIPSSV